MAGFADDIIIRVSIPQAVSTVATWFTYIEVPIIVVGFNTASGKYCCNYQYFLQQYAELKVSIPQAVSTVATAKLKELSYEKNGKFQYRKR